MLHHSTPRQRANSHFPTSGSQSRRRCWLGKSCQTDWTMPPKVRLPKFRSSSNLLFLNMWSIIYHKNRRFSLATLQKEHAGVFTDSKNERSVCVFLVKKGKNPEEDLPGFMHFSVASQFDPISAKTHHSCGLLLRALTFLHLERKHYTSPEETCWDGNDIVSSADPFNYFLGKSWSALIYCVLSPINVHSFLKLNDGCVIIQISPSLLCEMTLKFHL